MSDPIYPSEQMLRWWIEDLQSEDPLLKIALPRINDHWYKKVLGIFELLKQPYYDCGVHKKAAKIFYKVAKAHNYIDGNKRSSIIVVYLFYLVNGYYVPKSMNIQKMAKRVARSIGRSRYDWWIRKIESEFASLVIKLET